MTTMIINIIMMIITTIMTITTITMIIKEVRIPDMVKEAQEERKKTQSLELEQQKKKQTFSKKIKKNQNP